MAKPLLQRLQAKIGANRFLKLMAAYPPYLGAGVTLDRIEGEVDVIVVKLRLNALNRNFMGTQFGGSLYAMCDPWFMFLLRLKLGEPFVVWDKAATIRFLKPGKTAVRARFEISEAQLASIREGLARVGKVEPHFTVDVIDENGVVVAQVDKVLHAHDPRMKPKK